MCSLRSRGGFGPRYLALQRRSPLAFFLIILFVFSHNADGLNLKHLIKNCET